jgi:transaldolase
LNPLQALAAQGQSPWLDYIERDFVRGGALGQLIDTDGVRGVTSNPAIFAQAIATSSAYRPTLHAAAMRGLMPEQCYEELACSDVRDAADLLRPIFERNAGSDGFVSLEVSPALANDSAGTVAAAERLWRIVDRPNLMIKVPGTAAGIAAIPALVTAGINLNVTLLFARAAYQRVAEAWMSGLEARRAAGAQLAPSASVASFFVSRIDSRVDALLTACSEREPALAEHCAALSGRVAIANARLAYRDFQRITASARWRALAMRGAQPQRLLWASTGAKSAKYRDVVYVEELIGPATVNTLPQATLAAFRDHGRVRPSLTEDPTAAQQVLDQLAGLGIDLDAVTAALLEEGIDLFGTAYAALIDAVQGMYPS